MHTVFLYPSLTLQKVRQWTRESVICAEREEEERLLAGALAPMGEEEERPFLLLLIHLRLAELA